MQLYNSSDQLLLDTYEVAQVPEVALAAAEVLADSAVRILDMIEAIK